MVLRRSAVLAATALLCALPARAQSTLVLPQSHATQDGTTATNVPFGRSTPVRVQQVYDPLLFQGAGTVTAIAFRLDGDALAAPKQVDVEIRMSTSPLGLTALSATFAQNRGADETVVLPRQLVTLPDQNTAATPSPFLPALPLLVPFAYDPQNGPLLIEIVVFGQPPGAYTLDATFVCDSPETAIGPASCQPQTGLPLRVESATTQVLWGRPWLARALDAQPGSLVVLALGSTETGTWNGAQLPVDLTPAGAPGCFVSIDVLATFFQVAVGDGSALFTFAVPNEPALVGLVIRYQAAAFGANLNALGVVTSQAKKVSVCGYEPVGRVWSSGTTATDGVRELGTAPVLQITLQ
ncbi:MAG: hypothetical protein AB7O97_09445 [Planctomycetota bacterium]